MIYTVNYLIINRKGKGDIKGDIYYKVYQFGINMVKVININFN
jgi:hypothetical protein